MKYQVVCVNHCDPKQVGRPVFGPAIENACKSFVKDFKFRGDDAQVVIAPMNPWAMGLIRKENPALSRE